MVPYSRIGFVFQGDQNQMAVKIAAAAAQRIKGRARIFGSFLWAEKYSARYGCSFLRSCCSLSSASNNRCRLSAVDAYNAVSSRNAGFDVSSFSKAKDRKSTRLNYSH